MIYEEQRLGTPLRSSYTGGNPTLIIFYPLLFEYDDESTALSSVFHGSKRRERLVEVISFLSSSIFLGF